MSIQKILLMLLPIALTMNAPAKAAATASGSLAPQLNALAVIGCERVPEASSAEDNELQCDSDRSFFLCSQMQARDARLNCAIDAQSSKIDWSHQDATALIASPAFAGIVKAEPCVAWIYPEQGGAKHEYGERCAANILQSLHCELTLSGTPSAACPPLGQTACSALLETGYVQRCSLKAGMTVLPAHR